MNEGVIFILILLFYVAHILAKLSVNVSQISFLKSFSGEDKQFERDELDKAKEYALAKERFAIMENIYDLAAFLFLDICRIIASIRHARGGLYFDPNSWRDAIFTYRLYT